MRRIGFIICIFLLAVTGVQGQVRFAEFEGVEWWTHLFGWGAQDARFIDYDSNENTIVAGFFVEDLIFGNHAGIDTGFAVANPNQYPAHIFFAGLDSIGEFQWANYLIQNQLVTANLFDFNWSSKEVGLAAISLGDTVTAGNGQILVGHNGQYESAMGLEVSNTGTLSTVFEAYCPNGDARCYFFDYNEAAEEYVAFVSHEKFPLIINLTDTIETDTTVLPPFTLHSSIVRLDLHGEILQIVPMISLKGYMVPNRTEYDQNGNLILNFSLLRSFSLEEPIALIGPDTIFGRGLYLAKFNELFELDWIRDSQSSNWGALQLESDLQGNLYQGTTSQGNTSGSPNNAVLTKLGSNGDSLWSIQTNGSAINTHGLWVGEDEIILMGNYIDEFHYKDISFLSTTDFGAYPCSTGYLMSVNPIDGKVNWIMSESVHNEWKSFSDLAVSKSGKISLLAQFEDGDFTLSGDTILISSWPEQPDNIIFQIPKITLPDTTTSYYFEDFFLIFPNPNSGIFNIGLSENFPEGAQFEILDLRGRLIQKVNASDKKVIAVKNLHLPAGMYLAVMKNQKGIIQQTKKIIINTK